MGEAAPGWIGLWEERSRSEADADRTVTTLADELGDRAVKLDCLAWLVLYMDDERPGRE